MTTADEHLLQGLRTKRTLLENDCLELGRMIHRLEQIFGGHTPGPFPGKEPQLGEGLGIWGRHGKGWFSEDSLIACMELGKRRGVMPLGSRRQEEALEEMTKVE